MASATAGGELFSLAQFFQGEATRVGVGGTRCPKLLVAIVEMLRKLLDDLGFARSRQSEAGETSAQVGSPLRHGPLR